MNHVNTSPAVVEAAAQVNTLSVALNETTARLDAIQATQRAMADEPRNRLGDALALAGGKQVAPELPVEAGALMAKRDALVEGLALAQAAHRDALREQSIAYNATQAPKLLEAYEALTRGLRGTLDAFGGLQTIRQHAAAAGADPAAGGYTVEVDSLMRETLESYLKTVSDLGEELRDRITPDGAPVRVVVLADIEGGKPGDKLTLPGKMARLLARMGRVEVPSNAAKLKAALQ